MIEVPTNTWHKVDILVQKNDSLVVPTALPTFIVKDADTGSTLRTGTSVIDTADVGHYYVQLNPTDTNSERVLEISWSYALEGVTVNDSTTMQVSNIYVEMAEIIDELGLGAEPTDLNYQPLSKLKIAERMARLQINNYTGRKFGQYSGTQTSYGNGSDTVIFPERMTSFTKLWQDDELIYDSAANYNAYGYVLELTETGQGLRITNVESDIMFLPPTAYYKGEKLKFANGSRFKIAATFGYKYVPAEVRQAALLLISDNLHNDSLWRQKYIGEFDTGQMSVKLRDSAFTGTGNLLADDLLDPYKITGIVVI
jgi:hypothetical protein